MSKENLEQFMNQVADSEELQAKIGEEIDAEALIALGAECGCEFTAEELQELAGCAFGGYSYLMTEFNLIYYHRILAAKGRSLLERIIYFIRYHEFPCTPTCTQNHVHRG